MISGKGMPQRDVNPNQEGAYRLNLKPPRRVVDSGVLCFLEQHQRQVINQVPTKPGLLK